MEKHFTQDWFSSNIDNINKAISHLANLENLNFLEIGSFEGKSAVWFLENILTHETSTLTCIDTFEGSYEHFDMDLKNLYDIFLHNISEFKNKITVIKNKSKIGLLDNKVRSKLYDFIYIDGCHDSKEVLEDAVMSWELLKDNGIMIFDDYEWGDQNCPTRTPKLAIDSFNNCYKDKIEALNVGYQYTIKKIKKQ